MSDIAAIINHGIYVSGNFEVKDKTNPVNRSEPEGGIYNLTISCGGVNRENTKLYQIQAYAVEPVQIPLFVKGVYFLRGPFFPKNKVNTTFDSLIFEGEDHPFVGTGLSYMGSFVDSVSVTGTGIVFDICNPENSCSRSPADILSSTDNITKVVTVLHSQYHPIANQVSLTNAAQASSSSYASNNLEVTHTATVNSRSTLTHSDSDRSILTTKSVSSSTSISSPIVIENQNKTTLIAKKSSPSVSHKQSRLDSEELRPKGPEQLNDI
ncbi:uncharacterized protein MELLADRAFT_59586 [Melampsora larici-populina 98AG31]|uniref:Uncharacterized protein n=1 Tax=Melampsora larici-populina (strain 98AG31 / pathotype 3-4-7) TaxID=747676 RepID=F4R822_MELLP|nr:uncharacterized protein MELLADRAFT_59586 [Melampsora larici-populina 98AG31]EGG11420.1 hypothetical protein MELLADRAFT_59586 [Melampsora larici-populina 98AG31]